MKHIYFKVNVLNPEHEQILKDKIIRELEKQEIRDEDILVDKIIIHNIYKLDHLKDVEKREEIKFEKKIKCLINSQERNCISVSVTGWSAEEDLEINGKSFKKPIIVTIRWCPFDSCSLGASPIEEKFDIIARECVLRMTGKDSDGKTIFSSVEEMEKRLELILSGKASTEVISVREKTKDLLIPKIQRNMKDKDLVENLMFTVNEKAKDAMKRKVESTTEKEQCFQQGQYQAFSEVYTMLQNELNRSSEET